MQIAARTAAWAKSGGWVPEPRSFIFIRDNAYIDTAIIPTPTFGFLVSGRYNSPWGCLSEGALVRFHSQGNARNMSWPWQPGSFTSQPITPGTGDGDVYVDGTLGKYRFYDASGDTTNHPSFNLPFSIFLGARNYRGVIDNFGKQCVRRCASWENGEITHDYYPREIDGVAGLFDIVGDGGFISNGNTEGTVTYGVGDLPII